MAYFKIIKSILAISPAENFRLQKSYLNFIPEI